MLKTQPIKLWLFFLFCAVLMSTKVITAQTENTPSHKVKLFDDPRLIRWSADFLAGKREQVLRSVESDLKSSTPHPFSAYVWLRLRYLLTGKVLTVSDLKDEKLRRSLGVLPEVTKLYTSGDYRELLNRYPAATADQIFDLWALRFLFDAAISECRYDDAYLFAVRLAKVNPDSFKVYRLFVYNLIEIERIRAKIAALFGKHGELGHTELGRLLQDELESPISTFRDEEKKSRFLDAWLKEFPENYWALELKGHHLARSQKYDEAARILRQADRAFPFMGSFEDIAQVLILDDKRELAEALLKQRAPLMTKDSAAAADQAEEWIAEALMLTNDNAISSERGESALAMLEKALARRSDSPHLLALAAQAAGLIDSSEKSVDYARRAFETAPNDREYFEFYLSRLVNTKKYKEAQKLFRVGEMRYGQKSPLFWFLGAYAWLEHELEPGVTNLDSIKPEVWQILKRGQQDYPEAVKLMEMEALVSNFVDRRAEGRSKLKLAFTLSPPTPTTIEWLLRLQSGMPVEEKEAEFRELAKRYPGAATELEKHIRKLELYVQTGAADVVSLAFSQDSRILAAGTTSGTTKLWNAATGEELNTLSGGTQRINSISFSPDRRTVATGGYDNLITLWDLSTAKQLLTLNSDAYGINSIAFSPDQNVLGSGGDDRTVKLWSIATGEIIRTLIHTDEVKSISFSPDGKTIAGSAAESTKLWSTTTGKELKTIDNFDLPVFFAEGNMIAGRRMEQAANQAITFSVDILNVTTGRKVRTLEGRYTEPFNLIALSKDNKLLAVGGEDSEIITVWEVSTGRILHRFSGHETSIKALTFSPDNRMLASAGADGTVILWDPTAGKELLSLSKRVSADQFFRISPDGKWLASRNYNAINLWDLAGNQGLIVLRGHTGLTRSLAFSPNSNSLASGSSDGTVKLWSVSTGSELRTFRGNQGKVQFVEFSPNGQLLASSSFIELKEKITYHTQVWDLTSGQILLNIDGRHMHISDRPDDSRFAPNSRILATYGDVDPIQLWDVVTRKEVVKLSGDTRDVETVVFSADGTLIAGSFADARSGTATIRYWDVQTGNELRYDTIPGWARALNIKEEGVRVNSALKIQSDDLGLNLIDEKNQKVATLFALDDDGWIVLDRDGRFDASPSAEKLMHYNYGLQIISLDQLKEMYYAPGLLSKLLGHNKERLPAVVSLKDIKLHPEIVSHQLSPDFTRLTITLKNLGGGIGETRVLVNDKLVVRDARNAALKANPHIAVGSTVMLTVDLRGASVLKGKENKITVITSNHLAELGRGNIQSRGADIFYADSRQQETEMPTLYAIVGGVSDYEGDRIDLRFAAKDAEDFSNALTLAARRLYCSQDNLKCQDKVRIKTLSTARPNAEDQPTKDNFRKAFAWIAQQAQAEDIVVIYLAGHGVTFANGTDSYFFLTKDARSVSLEDLAKVYRTTAISNAELTDWLTLDQNIPEDIFIKSQRQLIILDTCAAGNFAREGPWNSSRELSGDQIRAMEFLRGKTGTFILMGSANSQPSYEASGFNQGLLTYALLEGMRGAALRPATSDVEVRLLLNYAERRVPELAREMKLEQKPVIKQPAGNSFLVGKMIDEDRLQINLPVLKPVLLRPRLTNPAADNDDTLNLIPELSKRFDLENSYEVMRRSGRGEPSFIYIDADYFPGAIRVTGTYTVQAETVKVKAFLRRDGLTIAALPEIVATKDTVLGKVVDAVRTALLRTARRVPGSPQTSH